jgi:hypothetical protein
MRRPATFTSICPKQATPRRSRTISSTNGTREADADTPATTTTRPLYVGTGYDLGFAADALRDDADGPWSEAVDAQNTALPDFTPQRRWTSVVLGALGMVVLAAVVIAVIAVTHRSSQPTEQAPTPAPPSTSAVASLPSAPTPSPPVPAAPPAYSSITATASTVVPPPPPVMQPGEPQPKPGVRQRLRDLFPRLFPGR